MILYLSGNKQIRGDLVKSAVLRSDLSPIPVTLEAEIRADDDMAPLLAEGEIVTNGAGDALRIIKSVRSIERVTQGSREVSSVHITAMLDVCHSIGFVRSRAIIKENSVLSSIYRAAGASLQAVDADFPAPRFTCPVGDTPSFHISRLLQEEGGVVRWKSGRLKFFRLADLFRQKATSNLPNNSTDDVESGFLERHEIPTFFSINEAGVVIFGDRSKPRSIRYSPFKNVQRLRSMSSCLVSKKIMKISFAGELAAGDLINFVGGDPLCIITAAHVFESGEGGTSQYTRLWLGGLQ